MTLLNGCAKTNGEKITTKINLPPFPFAGKEVGDEIKAVCNKDKCRHLYRWVTDLYMFNVQYSIYKEELTK